MELPSGNGTQSSFLRIFKHILYFCILPFALGALYRCANPMSPQGGPKDIIPPKIISAQPPNHSLHFNEKSIQLNFDEFVQLKDATNQVIISPPFLPGTEYKLRGKSLVIDINDTLQSNTTYRIYLGNSISDITENNVLKGADYVFSTGDYIDSLTISGKIVNAFDLVPQKDILACIYIDNNDTIPFDSLPARVPPYYIAKSDENGDFVFRNIMNRPLMLVALKDMNGDRIFNLPNEQIAFLDSLVQARYIPVPVNDTLAGDSLQNNDTLSKEIPQGPGIVLHLFEEKDSTQRILKADLEAESIVKIIFRLPNQSVDLTPLNFDSTGNWAIREDDPGKDTLLLFLRDIPADSLILKVANEKEVLDTVKIDLEKFRKKKTKKDAAIPEKLRFSMNLTGGKLNIFKGTLELTFSYPLDSADFSRIWIISEKDTIVPSAMFADSIHRRIRLTHSWEEETSYRLFVPDSVFIAYNGFSNDTVRLGFMTMSSRELGSFLVNVSIPEEGNPYIIQLMNDKDQVIVQKIITGSRKLMFDYLPPGKYKLKAIHDENRNGKWDTGDFQNRIQPEAVWIYPKPTEIRSNWDVEESWDIKEGP